MWYNKFIKFYNLILENSAMWTLNVNSSNDINISNLVINNNRHVANCDGIDICGSSNVVIKNCFISTADDGIALKNNMNISTSGDDGLRIKNNLDITCKQGMSNVFIHNCEVVSCTNAFKIGTETSLDISDVTVENCKFYLTDIYPAGVSGISIESCDGAKVKNININWVCRPRQPRCKNPAEPMPAHHSLPSLPLGQAAGGNNRHRWG